MPNPAAPGSALAGSAVAMTAEFFVLDRDPDPDEPDDPLEQKPDGSTPTVILDFEAVPDVNQAVEVAITDQLLSDVVELAFYCGGSPGVTQVIASAGLQVERRLGPRHPQPTLRPPSVFPPVFRPVPGVELPELPLSVDEHTRLGQLTTALGLLHDAEHDLRERVVDALAEVDDAARRVFLELLADTRVRCALAHCGLVDDDVDPLSGRYGTVLPFVDIANVDVDRKPTYLRLRDGIVRLDGLARGVRDLEREVSPYEPPKLASLKDSLVARADARAAFLKAWRPLVAEFPVLAVIGRDVLTATTGMEPHDLLSFAQDTTYRNRLDVLIRTKVRDALRDAWKLGLALAKDYLEAADRVREEAANRSRPADVVYGENHPLWQHSMIVWGGLQRIGAGPETVAYAATASALAIAAAAQQRRAVAAAEEEDLLNSMQLGFGVATMIPVIGEAAGIAGAVVAAVRALMAVSAYQSDTSRRQAFGVYADRLELPDPDGLGVVLKVANLAPDVLPVLGPAAKLAGRYLRVAALGAELSPAGQAAGHAVGVRGADFLPLVLEGLGIALGKEMERRAGLPIPVE